ncbi:hypothetical protein ACF3NX_12480 [Acetobacter orientalis]|uniref:hypothetical protein n=1 Tax=Acetobacter orientalis TaxID=146474 RepID=UPI003867065B
MTEKPTGVFVRLPLSEEQRGLMVDAAALGQPDDSHDKAILTICTPVTGGELDTSRESFEQFYAQMCTEATGRAGVMPDYVRGLRNGDNYGPRRLFLNNVWEAWPNFAIFALAKLAEKDAEIARYREALIEAKTFHEEQDKSLSKQPPSSQGSWRRNLHQEQIEQIEAALKGQTNGGGEA